MSGAAPARILLADSDLIAACRSALRGDPSPHPIAVAGLIRRPKSVERHRANLLDELGMRDSLALTRFAIRTGLIEPSR